MAGEAGGSSVSVLSEVITYSNPQSPRIERRLKDAYFTRVELFSTPIEASEYPSEQPTNFYSSSPSEFVERLRDGSINRWEVRCGGERGWLICDGGEFRLLQIKPELLDNAPVPQYKQQLPCGAYLYEFTTTIRVDAASLSLFESNDDIIQWVKSRFYGGLGFGERCRLRKDGRFVRVRETRLDRFLGIFQNGAGTARAAIGISPEAGSSSPPVITAVVRGAKPGHRRRGRVVSSALDLAQTTVSALAEISSSFPPVAATAKAMHMVFTVKDKIKDHRTLAKHETEKAIKLKEDVEEFIRITSQNRSEFPMEAAQATTLACDEVQQKLRLILESKLWLRISRIHRNKDTIQDCQHRLALAQRDFTTTRVSYLVRLNNSINQRTESLQANVIQIKWLCSCIAISIACF